MNQEAKEMANREDVPLKTHVVAGHEVQAIVDYVREHHFDLVVIGFMGHFQDL